LSKTPGGIVAIESDCSERVVVAAEQLVQERVALVTVQHELAKVREQSSRKICRKDTAMCGKSFVATRQRWFSGSYKGSAPAHVERHGERARLD